MRYITGVYWARGAEADSNQDSVVLLQVLTARGRVLMAAVCDGMGGHAQGVAASSYVTKRLQEWFYESLLRAIRRKKACWVIRRSLDRLVYHMQEKLEEYGRRQGVSLGAAMTVAVLWEKTYYLWHLGDTRAYRFAGTGSAAHRRDRGIGRRRRAPGVSCMTRDHTEGAGRLTKCVGNFGHARPDFMTGILKEGQGMLLCSNGFCRHTSDAELSEVLDPRQIREEEQIGRRLREIGSACVRRGGKDDLSAIYIKAEKMR